MPADSGPSQHQGAASVADGGLRSGVHCDAGPGPGRTPAHGGEGDAAETDAGLPGGSWRLRWELKRRAADIATELEFIAREAHQLSQKRFVNPRGDAIRVSEQEKQMLHEHHLKRLQDIVQRHCLPVLKNLMSHRWAYPFNEPVDINLYHDYLKHVEQPMDLGTVKARIHSYRNPEEVRADVQMVFDNAKKYNPVGTDVRKMSGVLEERFHERWKRVIVPKLEEEERALVNEEAALKQSKAGLMVMRAEGDVDHCCVVLLQRLEKLVERIQYCQCLSACACRILSSKERVRLGWVLATLPADHFQRAANLLVSRHPGLMATMKENTVQLDLEAMDALTLRQLQDFVRRCTKSPRRVAQSDQGSDVNGDPPPRKRQKLENLTGGSTPRLVLESSRSSVLWPSVPFGIGLKAYRHEVEACVPPECDSFRPPPSRMHSEPIDPSHIALQKAGGLSRTLTAPAASVVSQRTSAGGVQVPAPAQLQAASEVPPGGLQRRLITHRSPMSDAGRPLVERVLLRTQGSGVGSNTLTPGMLGSRCWGRQQGGEGSSVPGQTSPLASSGPNAGGQVAVAPGSAAAAAVSSVGLNVIALPQCSLVAGVIPQASQQASAPASAPALAGLLATSPPAGSALGHGLPAGGLSSTPAAQEPAVSSLQHQPTSSTAAELPAHHVPLTPVSMSLPILATGVLPISTQQTVLGAGSLLRCGPSILPAVPLLTPASIGAASPGSRKGLPRSFSAAGARRSVPQVGGDPRAKMSTVPQDGETVAESGKDTGG